MSNMCAKMAQGRAVPVVWSKVKQAGITEKKLLHNLLHVATTFAPMASSATCSTAARRRRKSKYTELSILDILDNHQPDENATDDDDDDTNQRGNDDENDGHDDDDDDLMDTVDEIAIYHDLLYDATEQTVNIRVRLLVAQNKPHEAARLLSQYATPSSTADDEKSKKK